MPSATIPLIGSFNQRGTDAAVTLITNGKDQYFKGVFPQIVRNQGTGNVTIYAQKRPGLEALRTPASGSYGTAISEDGVVTCFGASNTVYFKATSCGVLNEAPDSIVEVKIGGETYYMIVVNAGGGWFVPLNAVAAATTFTADTSSGSAVLLNVSSTTGVYVGQLLSGTGIAATARVQSIDSGTQITMTANATATNSTVTITRTHLAKIIDADFPSSVRGRFCEADGYLHVMDYSNSRVYSSDLGSVTAWSASSYVTANMRADGGVTVFPYVNQIGALCTNHLEFFYNAGNPSGSPLGRTENLMKDIGAAVLSLASLGKSVAMIRGMVFWSGNNDFGGDSGVVSSSSATLTPGIWMLAGGFEPKRISDPTVENILFSVGAQEIINVDAFSFNGGTYIRCHNPSDTPYVQLCYHIESGLWFDPGLPAGYLFANDTSCIDSVGTGGKVYRMENSSPVYQDDGVAYTMTIQTSRVNHGTHKKKTVNSVSLIGDIQSSGTATLETSDDDGATWVTRGTFDLTKINPQIHRCGHYAGGRQYRITHSANTAFRAEALEIEYEVGQH